MIYFLLYIFVVAVRINTRPHSSGFWFSQHTPDLTDDEGTTLLGPASSSAFQAHQMVRLLSAHPHTAAVEC